MLELIGIMEQNRYTVINDYEFKFQKYKRYKNRKVFSALFFISDNEANILYCYTQDSIEREFYEKGLDILGLVRQGTYLKSVENNRKLRFYTDSLIIVRQNYKLIMGNDILGIPLKIIYKRLRLSECYLVNVASFNDIFESNVAQFLAKESFVATDLIGYRVPHYPTDINIDINEKIDVYNEWVQYNSTVVVNSLFEHQTYSNMDISELDTKGVFMYRNLFNGCKDLETVKLCKMELSRPLFLNNMFIFCNSLKLIDMTNLVGDYPSDYFGANIDKLKSKLDLGFKNSSDNLIMVFNKTAPNFIKLLADVNNLVCVGTIRKETRTEELNKLMSKFILFNKKGLYYVVEE